MDHLYFSEPSSQNLWMAAVALMTTLALATGCHCESIYVVDAGANPIGGWTVPPKANYFQKWADEREFVVNDILYFQYDSSIHNVMVVTEAALDNCCIADNVLASDQSGSTAVALSSNNTNYYFMSNGSDCQAGMRFRLTVGNPGCDNQSSSSMQVPIIPADYRVYTLPWSPQTNPDWSHAYYPTNSPDTEKAASSPSLPRSLHVLRPPPIIALYNYSKSDHYSVNLVGEKDFKQCKSSKPLKTYKFGESIQLFTESEARYFIDGNQSLCQNSYMKFAVSAPGSAEVAPSPLAGNPTLSPTPVKSPGEVAPSPRADNHSPNKSVPVSVMASVVVSAAVASSLLTFGVYAALQHRNRRGHKLHNVINKDFGRKGMFKIFTANELKVATNNFSGDNELGKGAFATVYKGRLRDGQVVAIKRSITQRATDIEHFINEVSILSQVKHSNLVKLMGCCVDSKLPLVVYEFIPNGTLQQHLRKSQGCSSTTLDWPCRLRIAIQIAEALKYLHSEANPPIVHRDIKAANILLDNDFGAKVADFGISKLFDIGATHISTAVKGTPGYMDPEYYLNSQLTEKSDVYSYGMVLLELITSKKPIDLSLEPEEQNLAVRLVPLIKRKRGRDIIDSELVREFSEEDFETVEAVAQVAVACLANERALRPSMTEVVEMLRRIEGGEKNGRNTFQLFSSNELKMATNSFASENKLANGSCGDVYKGLLKNGQVVAIKRARTDTAIDMEQFFNEVSVLSQVNHPNLVNLMGCCVDSKLPLVVCEFVSNGTLKDHLSKSEQSSSSNLDWPCRLRIAIQIAEGLKYLHSQANPPIVHRDVKASNILLDDHFQAKVADFGISKLFDLEATHISTGIKGTPGYMDPEYFLTSQLTEKSDVYGYGMVLLELITSKKPIDVTFESADRNLAVRLIPVIKNKRARDIIDRQLVKDFSEEDFQSVEVAAEVAAACLAKERASRPSMTEVVEMLRSLKVQGESISKTDEIPNSGTEGENLSEAMIGSDPAAGNSLDVSLTTDLRGR